MTGLRMNGLRMDGDATRRLAELVATHSANVMGFADHLEVPADPERLDVWVRRVGGGVIAGPRQPRGRIELHVIPHSGTEAPPGLLAGRWRDADLGTLAELIARNSDLGTARIASKLIQAIPCALLGGRSVHVAYFAISRLFLDANRLLATDQVPLRPYSGSASDYHDFLRRHGDALRESLLPWLDEVNALIRDLRPPVVYHHHTYDVVGQAARPWDADAFGLRPLAQVFWQRPSLNGVRPAAAAAVDERGFAPRAVLEAMAEIIAGALAGRTRQRPSVRLDHPLMTPPMPYLGCILDSGGTESRGHPWHVIYELRKDLLNHPLAVDAWLAVIDTIVSAVDRLRQRHDPSISNQLLY